MFQREIILNVQCEPEQNDGALSHSTAEKDQLSCKPFTSHFPHLLSTGPVEDDGREQLL